jgi:hypothetical protein
MFCFLAVVHFFNSEMQLSDVIIQTVACGSSTRVACFCVIIPEAGHNIKLGGYCFSPAGFLLPFGAVAFT